MAMVIHTSSQDDGHRPHRHPHICDDCLHGNSKEEQRKARIERRRRAVHHVIKKEFIENTKRILKFAIGIGTLDYFAQHYLRYFGDIAHDIFVLVLLFHASSFLIHLISAAAVLTASLWCANFDAENYDVIADEIRDPFICFICYALMDIIVQLGSQFSPSLSARPLLAASVRGAAGVYIYIVGIGALLSNIRERPCAFSEDTYFMHIVPALIWVVSFIFQQGRASALETHDMSSGTSKGAFDAALDDWIVFGPLLVTAHALYEGYLTRIYAMGFERQRRGRR